MIILLNIVECFYALLHGRNIRLITMTWHRRYLLTTKYEAIYLPKVLFKSICIQSTHFINNQRPIHSAPHQAQFCQSQFKCEWQFDKINFFNIDQVIKYNNEIIYNLKFFKIAGFLFCWSLQLAECTAIFCCLNYVGNKITMKNLENAGFYYKVGIEKAN